MHAIVGFFSHIGCGPLAFLFVSQSSGRSPVNARWWNWGGRIEKERVLTRERFITTHQVDSKEGVETKKGAEHA